MAYEIKDGQGSLFKNERKEKDTHPDRTGKAMIGGVMYWVNGWLKTTKSGEPWLSLAFKPIEQPHGDSIDREREIVFQDIPF